MATVAPMTEQRIRCRSGSWCGSISTSTLHVALPSPYLCLRDRLVAGGVAGDDRRAVVITRDEVDPDGSHPTRLRLPSFAMGRPRTPKGRARETEIRLAAEYPDARCELDHDGPFQLLAATILSAQCTDERVNTVTPALFARYPTPEDLAIADPAELEAIIRPTGFFHNKAKSLVGMASALVDRYDSTVPGPMEDLVTVPGVGRKTANVVRSVALGLPGLPVDTHVLRLSRRLGLTTADGSGEGRARAQRDDLARGARAVQPPVDPPRTASVRRPHPSLSGLRTAGLLPLFVDPPGPLEQARRVVTVRGKRGGGVAGWT